jgi:hypothetical protein
MSGRLSFPKDDVLRTAHIERERATAQNNKEAKLEQLKLSKTGPST